MDIVSSFDQVRIINLVHRSDRRAECLEEYARWDLPTDTTRFYGATKPTSVRANWAHMPTGVYGCWMSHLTVLKEFVASEDETMLVLEDDIRFTAPRSELLNSLPAADIIFFGFCGRAPEGNHGWRFLQPTEQHQGLHCYGVTRAAAARLVPYLEACMSRPDGHPAGGPMHVDGAVNMFRATNPDIVAAVVEPYLAGQRSSASNIHEDLRTRLSHLPVLGTVLSTLRQLKNRLAA